MKRWLFLSFLSLLFAFSANGQQSNIKGLFLTGTIIDLNVVPEYCRTDTRLLVQVELAMQFRNGSDRPLIVMKPKPRWLDPFGGNLGSTRVNLLRGLPSIADKQSERIQAINTRSGNCHPSIYTQYRNDDRLSSFIKSIDLPGPTSDFFEVIEPGGYYTFIEYVTLDTGFELEVKLGRSLREARISSEFPAFQIEYHLSLKGNAKGEGLFQTLRSRWETFGNLILDESGDFTIISEPIVNRTSG
ncbi:MAG TPA: hypothetical protein PKD24_06695 [Pyrinomonadaceae bacterium]|nr:hypothetical protein [Pyrinomonadaceae bacterium]HMP65155.1 hypothetical protein [Pyrinomonadaceae bacterium]